MLYISRILADISCIVFAVCGIIVVLKWRKVAVKMDSILDEVQAEAEG